MNSLSISRGRFRWLARPPRHAGCRGWILPLVLLCAALLAGNLFLFHFISSSDYSQVRRLGKSAQAAALADLASDEAYVITAEIEAKPGAPPSLQMQLPEWVDGLLKKLEAKRAAAGPGGVTRLDVVHEVDFSDRLKQTFAAGDQVGGGLAVESAKVRMGPFDVVPGSYDSKLFYAEPLFGDDKKDPRPWDLRGPFVVEVAIRIARGDLAFTQRYVRGQELAIADTMPPAGEFAVFNFLPPPDQDYALNDLQRGGRLTVYPFDTGRVMVRGPLLLVPEDAPDDKPFLGGTDRAAPSVSYPTPGKKRWTGWAAPPGPRALQYPMEDASHAFQELRNFITSWLNQAAPLGELGPRRPRQARSSPMTFGPLSIQSPLLIPFLGTNRWVSPSWTVNLSLVIGVGLPDLASIYWPLNDDEIAYFHPEGYHYGPLPRRKQTFSILGDSQFVPDGGGVTSSTSMFRGGRIPEDSAKTASEFKQGLAGLAGVDGAEGELLAAEPLPRPSDVGFKDKGVLAMYHTARFDSATWIAVSALDMLGRLACAVLTGGVATPVCEGIIQVIKVLNLDPTPRFMVRTYETSTPPEPPAALEPAAIDAATQSHDAVLVPYGLYWHGDSFWTPQYWEQGLFSWVKATVENAVFTLAVDGLAKMVGAMLGGASAEKVIAAAGGDGGAKAQAAMSLSRQIVAGLEKAMSATLQFLLSAGKKVGQETAKSFATEALSAGADELISGPFQSYPPPPKAAVDPTALRVPGPDRASYLQNYPHGFYPPGHRDWPRTATREFPDMQSYLAADARDGVLELRGTVRVRKLDCTLPEIRYKGRGTIVVVTADATVPARLDAIVEPVAGQESSHLILAHCVTAQVAKSGNLPPLKLGQKFVGTVYSDTGVAPAGQATLIVGNLVTGWLNKRGISDALSAESDGVHVVYASHVGNGAGGTRLPFWSLDLVGEISAVEPGK